MAYPETITNLAVDDAIPESWVDAVKTNVDQLVLITNDGWVPHASTWAFGTADGPTATMTTGTDQTSRVSVGMRVRLTHAAAVKYFIVTAVSFGGGTTTVTLYGGTDYTLAAGAITLVSFSPCKAPLGFPMSPLKWQVEVLDTSDRQQASPVGGTWYNPGAITISIPIGAWRVSYQAAIQVTDTGNSINESITLSTANNTQSDADFTAYVAGNQNEVTMVHREKHLLLAAKTSYFLNISATAAYTNINILGAKSKTIIRAVCAYL
jgi:hypothetical protein